MFCGCFAASATGCTDCVHSITTSEEEMVGCNVGPSVTKLGLRPRSKAFQQNNDPTQISKNPPEMDENKVLEAS